MNLKNCKTTTFDHQKHIVKISIRKNKQTKSSVYADRLKKEISILYSFLSLQTIYMILFVIRITNIILINTILTWTALSASASTTPTKSWPTSAATRSACSPSVHAASASTSKTTTTTAPLPWFSRSTTWSRKLDNHSSRRGIRPRCSRQCSWRSRTGRKWTRVMLSLSWRRTCKGWGTRWRRSWSG